MALISTEGAEEAPKAKVTGVYQSADGIHHRVKAGDALPEGWTLVTEERARDAAPENKAKGKAPENRSAAKDE